MGDKVATVTVARTVSGSVSAEAVEKGEECLTPHSPSDSTFADDSAKSVRDKDNGPDLLFDLVPFRASSACCWLLPA